jgi:hypothetical protein
MVSWIQITSGVVFGSYRVYLIIFITSITHIACYQTFIHVEDIVQQANFTFCVQLTYLHSKLFSFIYGAFNELLILQNPVIEPLFVEYLFFYYYTDYCYIYFSIIWCPILLNSSYFVIILHFTINTNIYIVQTFN